MAKSQKNFSISLLLASIALGEGFRSESPITVRSSLAAKNTVGLPRRNPKIYSPKIVVPWAASVLLFITRLEGFLTGYELEYLRIGLCDEAADDELFVSLYERSQLPKRWNSDDSLPIEWRCDELVARLVREGSNPVL